MSRQEILEQLADQHEAQLKRTLKELEEEILSSISRATGGSELIDTRIAIELRKDIKRHLQETYLFVDQVLFLFLLKENYLHKLAIKNIKAYVVQFAGYVQGAYESLYNSILVSQDLSDQDVALLKKVVDEFNIIFAGK